MNRNKWIAGAAIAALVVVPVAAKLLRSGDAKSVEAQKVSLLALSPSILASGTLTYQSEVKLVSEVIGRVKEVLVQEGDRVMPGEILLRLDPASSLAEIAQLEAAKQQSELHIRRQRVSLQTQLAKWKRYEALREKGIVDINTYEEIVSQRDLASVEVNTSEAMLKQTEAQMKQARERLAKTEIRSPIAGKVTAVFISAGETAVPSATSIAGSDLMIIADTSTMYAEVNVDETDIARVGVEQTARIVPAAFPDKAWSGQVEHVAIAPQKTTGQSKTYAVKIRLDASEEVQFHPGMSCRAEISTRRADAQKVLAVPVQAVRYEESEDTTSNESKASVFVIEAGKVHKRSVETGTADDAYIEIVRGLREQEEVAVGPAKTLRFLQDGERVAAETPTPQT
jgi:HlyD family secretion protein